MAPRKPLPLIVVTVFLLFVTVIAISAAALYRYYLLLSFVCVGLALVPFLIKFELRKVHTREIVLLTMLIAIAAVSRVPFASLPSIQPTTFIIIVSGVVFGAESGFLIGALAALVSNMFLGQGPWTPWQMFSWGMIGYAAGVLGQYRFAHHRIALTIFGFVCGFLFGWVMNLTQVFALLADFSWTAVWVKYTASFPFDLAHAICNAVLLWFWSDSWIQVLKRYRTKYGLLEQAN